MGRLTDGAVIAVGFILAACSPAAATELRVCKGGCAYSAIGSAIAAARDGDTVLVEPGTYAERIDFSGKTLQVVSSGGPGVTVIDGGGGGTVVTINSDASGEESLLSGFTIRNGKVNDDGGGILKTYGTARVSGCVIRDNAAASSGGGAYTAMGDEDLVIEDSKLLHNKALGNGGGAFGCTLRRCTLRGNAAGNYGGGGCDVKAYDCVIEGNVAEFSGGGIGHFSKAERCDIRGNRAGRGGGASVGSTLVNCMITGNRANYGGGVEGHSNRIINSTIAGNYAAAIGGGLQNYSYSAGDITVVNSIVYGNKAKYTYGDNKDEHAGGGFDIAYSNVRGGYPGKGNISVDPRFAYARPAESAPTAVGDYRLQPGSPCIDRGTDLWVGLPADDRFGSARPVGAGYDMGAHEYGGRLHPYLRNQSFEYGSVLPVAWRGTSLGRDDRRTSVTASLGKYSFQMVAPAQNRMISQVITTDGTAGSTLAVTARSRALGTAAGGFHGVFVTLHNADGTRSVFRKLFPVLAHGWIRRDLKFVAPKAYTGVEVSLRFTGSRGRVWFDDVWIDLPQAPPVVTRTPTTLATGLNYPWDLASDGSSIYWTEIGDGLPGSGKLRKVGIGGGSVTTLASGLNHPQAIALDATHVYWAEHGRVRRVAKGGGSLLMVQDGLNYAPNDIVVDDAMVYWTAGSGVIRAAKDGSGGEWIAGGGATAFGLAQDATSLYWADMGYGVIRKIAKTGGTVTTLVSGLSNPRDVAYDGLSIYWSEMGDNAIRKLPLAGGNPVTLVSGLGDDPYFTLDEEAVYFTALVVAKVGNGGGTVTPLVTSYLIAPDRIINESGYLYWIELGGTLKKLSKH